MGLSRRKLRRVAKWVGLVVVVGVICVFCASCWFGAVLMIPTQQMVGVENGVLYTFTSLRPGRWAVALYPGEAFRSRNRPEFPCSWWFKIEHYPLGERVINIPLWFVALICAVPTAWLWWRDYRDKPPDRCAKCGYDLRGLAKGEAGAVTCPECGKVGAG